MKTLLLSLVLAFVAFAQQPPVRSVICNDAGASDTYTCTASPTLTAYTAGMRVQFKPNTANTGTATLAIDGLAAITIVKLAGAIKTTLDDNDLRAGQYVLMIYDGTNFQVLSELGNAAAASGGAQVMSCIGIAVNQGVTNMCGPGNTMGSTEQSVMVTMTHAGSASKLYVHISAAQPASQTLTCNVRKIAAGSAWATAGTPDTAVQVVINGSDPAGVYSDLTGSLAYVAGDRMSVGCTQQAGASSSAQIRMISWEYQ